MNRVCQKCQQAIAASSSFYVWVEKNGSESKPVCVPCFQAIPVTKPWGTK